MPTFLIFFVWMTGCVSTPSSYNVPSPIDISANYLFFLHGRITEKKGAYASHPNYGTYDYHKMVKAFMDQGFVVISEIRPKGTKLDKYARKIVRQIKALLADGIPPEQITVVGFSKGSVITLLVSAKLMNPKVNFVLMSGCSHKGTHVLRSYKKLIGQSVQFMQGRFLSIYDVSDHKCDICQKIFKNASGEATFKEIKVKSGLGHSLFYRPRRDWIEPVIEWINQKH